MRTYVHIPVLYEARTIDPRQEKRSMFHFRVSCASSLSPARALPRIQMSWSFVISKRHLIWFGRVHRIADGRILKMQVSTETAEMIAVNGVGCQTCHEKQVEEQEHLFRPTTDSKDI